MAFSYPTLFSQKTTCIKDGTLHHTSVCVRGWRGDICAQCPGYGDKHKHIKAWLTSHTAIAIGYLSIMVPSRWS
jgi:hypothetical protein